MKICLIELMPFPYTVGGGTTHIMNLGKALVELGNEVHVISSRPAKDYEWIKNTPKSLIIHNVGMRHKKFEGGISYYPYRLLFELSFVLAARKKIKEIRPDIIDCQSSITTALPASLNKFPFVITSHGIHSQGFEKLYKSKGKDFVANILNNIYASISRYNSKRAQKIISQGKTTLDYYTSLVGDSSKGVLVSNLVDVDNWAFSPKKDSKLIVTVARLTKQKALDKLILAINKLPDYKLMIAGDGELEKELKVLAGKNITFLGYQTPDQCKELYNKAQFTILPSEFEGLPYSILEAMSTGVIPITTRVGDLQELIKTKVNGFLLPDNKQESIVQTVKTASKMNLKKLSEQARKTIVERYGAKQVAQIFLDNYKEAIKAREQ